MKAHLVFNENASDVHGAVQALPEVKVTGWDYNLDTAAQWAGAGQGDTPDIIFLSGIVGVSTIDTQTGRHLTREQAMLKRLREIRLSRPQSRIILVLPQSAREKRQFIHSLIALGIYDIYFVAEFDEEDIKQWFGAAKGITDMEEFLPGGVGDDSEDADKVKELAEQKSEVKKTEVTVFFHSKFGRIKSMVAQVMKKISLVSKEPAAGQHNSSLENTLEESFGIQNKIATCSIRQEFANLALRQKEKREPVICLKPVGKLKTRVLIVVGAAPRVGATSFALAMAKILSITQEVEILDAGGGAEKWFDIQGKLSVRSVPPFSISPGVVTVVDAGTEVPSPIQPISEAVFVVTDLSRNALELQPYSRAGKVYLVGSRGAPPSGLKELASLWGMDFLFSLPEDITVREAEIARKIIVPKTWQRQFKIIERMGRKD